MSAPALPTRLVRLTYPVEFEGGFADVIMVRPLFDSEGSLNSDPEMANIENIATASNLPVSAILDLDPRDFLAVFEATAAAARSCHNNLGATHAD